MKTILSILAVTAAFGAPVAIWAQGAGFGPGLTEMRGPDAFLTLPSHALPLILVSDDEDDEDETDEDHHDDCDDDDDDDDCRAIRRQAPSSPGNPPANGLFGTGAPRTVKVN